jgi:hypothetical protein
MSRPSDGVDCEQPIRQGQLCRTMNSDCNLAEGMREFFCQVVLDSSTASKLLRIVYVQAL